MQSAAEHLACGSTQNHCTDWFSAAREMLRCVLHDRPLPYRYFGTSLIALFTVSRVTADYVKTVKSTASL